MGVRENKVETYLNTQIVKLGGVTRKWVSPGRAGVPDRIVFVDAMIVFVEVKTVDGKLMTVQTREQELLRSHGAHVVTVYGESGVDAFISEFRLNPFKCEFR